MTVCNVKPSNSGCNVTDDGAVTELLEKTCAIFLLRLPESIAFAE